MCPICTKVHQHNTEILLNKMLKDIGEIPITDSSICDECEPKMKEFIALVGIDPDKSETTENTVKQQDAYRTGKILFLKRDKASEIFTEIDTTLPFVFVDDEVVTLIQGMVKDK